MSGFVKWTKEFFDDNTGGASLMRLMFAMWMVVFCSVMVFVDIKAKTLVPIPEGYIYITGLLAAAKVGQRMWGEKDTSTTTVLNPTTGNTTTLSTSGMAFLQSTPSGSI